MEKRGKMLDMKALYMTIHVGEATDKENGIEYQMALMANSSPVITSDKTDKRFNLSWQDIINMAIEAGIDK